MMFRTMSNTAAPAWYQQPSMTAHTSGCCKSMHNSRALMHMKCGKLLLLLLVGSVG
jgi:hypothetical protein